MTTQAPSKEMIEVPKALIVQCFHYVNERFQLDPASRTHGELWRLLNHEITRSRAAHEPAHDPDDAHLATLQAPQLREIIKLHRVRFDELRTAVEIWKTAWQEATLPPGDGRHMTPLELKALHLLHDERETLREAVRLLDKYSPCTDPETKAFLAGMRCNGRIGPDEYCEKHRGHPGQCGFTPTKCEG